MGSTGEVPAYALRNLPIHNEFFSRSQQLINDPLSSRPVILQQVIHPDSGSQGKFFMEIDLNVSLLKEKKPSCADWAELNEMDIESVFLNYTDLEQNEWNTVSLAYLSRNGEQNASFDIVIPC